MLRCIEPYGKIAARVLLALARQIVTYDALCGRALSRLQVESQEARMFSATMSSRLREVGAQLCESIGNRPHGNVNLSSRP